jgi:pimeloyl-ACP methyl ester carboxylesterase
LFVTIFGAGPAVLFAHSWGFNSDMWTYQLPALATAGHQVVTYDRRGHGRSDRATCGYDLDTLADDLSEVVHSLDDPTDLTLVGHSLGCSEIVRCLATRPELPVARVVLVSPILPFLVRAPDNPGGVAAAELVHRFDAIRTDLAQWCSDNTAGFFGVDEVNAELTSWLTRQILETPLHILLETMAAFAADLRADVRGLRVPALVIHGDADLSAPVEITGRPTSALLSDGQLAIYQGGGHGLFASRHGRLTHDILRFMGTRPAAA